MREQDKEDIKKRPIRSYILRQGRITAGQTKAIQENFQKYAVIFQNKLTNFSDLFKNKNSDLILEIGFGMGTSTAEIAKSNLNKNYIAIEVHSPGVGNLLKLIKESDISNLKIIQHDAVEVLNLMVKNNSLDGIHIFFPDPWPKKRHHKRRLIQSNLLKLIAQKIKKSGYLHIATDWEDYALWIIDLLDKEELLQKTSDDFFKKPDYRPLTKYENRGIKLGYRVWDMIYRRI
ncbi:MAG TPA: tRNA (guanosine(46)-N7)-methyltransferase TrmB [Methylophilaceae bacterium]|jgi:tRNA (guanine-N7-)-methyltransferase|nr:tRNA (guanosine(46)-N7)-methyltransferase TrmB [Methylophilaceae bacterium]HCB68294.1 tRNA (guanosine(46)-N7)-methyltransferase TrmB [Methylophilaceae bacterium]HCC72741.1 tRNA (guanosine(46)-N7)-methyltransferase TrmB [Methylophilaceae bacterium]